MLPITNSFPHNHPSGPNGVQSFDLKVNVDFNTGYVRLNMPHGPVDPFGRKQLIPISHAMPQQHQNYVPQYIPLGPQQPHQQQYSPPSNHKVSLSTLAPQASGSLNSTFHMEQSLQAVECVICQKIIKRQEFNLHLEEHRNRRKTEIKTEQPQHSFQHSSEVSIRDKNSFAEATELIKEMPFHQQRKSQSNLLYFPSQSSLTSRQSIQPPIYGSPQSEFFLSQSSNFSKPTFEVCHGNQSISSQFSPHNSLPPGFEQANQLRAIHNQPFPMQVISQSRSFPNERAVNPFHFHRIESVIIRPEFNKQQDQQLDYCGQSVISRNSMPSRQSSVYEIQRELEKKKEDDCSSDEQDFHYRTYPIRAHHSMGWTQPPVKKDEMKMSQYTEKSSRTKLPLNYLAREEFISNSTLNSWASKSKFPQ